MDRLIRSLKYEPRAVAANEFVPLDGRRAPAGLRSPNSMARKTLLAGGKDFPAKPRGARARRSLRLDPQFLDHRPPFLNASLNRAGQTEGQVALY